MNFLCKGYRPRKIFWLIRVNVVFMRDMRTLEITVGVFGYGVLLLVQKSMVKDGE